ncbi:MAG: hypothetical protein ACP5D0_03385 [Hydrogenovibrio sp.]
MPCIGQGGKHTFSTWTPLLTLDTPKGKPESLVVQKQAKSPGLVFLIAQDGLKNGGIKAFQATD